MKAQSHTEMRAPLMIIDTLLPALSPITIYFATADASALARHVTRHYALRWITTEYNECYGEAQPRYNVTRSQE